MFQALISPLASCTGKVFLGVGSGTALSAWPSSAFHELGHALALKTLFSDVSPTIQVYWGGGGLCDPNGPCEKQTRIGKLFTRGTCFGIISAAGSVFDLVNVAASGTMARWIAQSHPTISTALSMNAIMKLCFVTQYACNFKDIPHHDFQEMSKCFNIPRKRFIQAAAAICAFAGPLLFSNLDWANTCQHHLSYYGQCYVDKSPIDNLWPWS